MTPEKGLPITASEVQLMIESPPVNNDESSLGGLMVVIKPEDSTTFRSHRFKGADNKPSLGLLQSTVGGYIEGCSLDTRLQAYCNEEGKLQGMAANNAATELLGWAGRDVLCGTVVILFGFPEDE